MSINKWSKGFKPIKRLHTIYGNIHSKCYNLNHIQYRDDINVCLEWHYFENFQNWALQNGYTSEMVLHRKDSNKNYCPENCEWISDSLHRAKRGKLGYILTAEYNGVILPLNQISKLTGINYETLKSRRLKGRDGLDLIQPLMVVRKKAV